MGLIAQELKLFLLSEFDWRRKILELALRGNDHVMVFYTRELLGVCLLAFKLGVDGRQGVFGETNRCGINIPCLLVELGTG